MNTKRKIRNMIIEELLNDDAMFSRYDSPGESNQELVSKMIKNNEMDLVDPNDESGSYMTHSQLFNIRKQAEYLLKNLPEGVTLEPWMESKLTSAHDALDAVFESLFSKIEKHI